MGTRHQIYVIARVNGAYRVVALFHGQSLYPYDAVRLAVVFLTAIKAHSDMIAKELHALSVSTFASPITTNNRQNNTEEEGFPCPFLTKLGWDVLFWDDGGRNEPPHRAAVPEAIETDPEWQDNNSGFTIFDLTDAASPQICFLNVNPYTSDTPTGTPLTPTTYALEFFGPDDGSRYFEGRTMDDLDGRTRKAVLILEGVPLVERAALFETFKTGTYTTEDDWNQYLRSGRFKTSSPPTLPPKIRVNSSMHQISSLTLIAFQSAFESVSSSGTWEDATLVASALVVPSVAEEGLCFLSNRHIPEHCTPILAAALAIYTPISVTKEVDFRCYDQLSKQQLIEIFKSLADIDVQAVDLSNNAAVDASIVRTCIKSLKKSLKRLVLFNTPGLSRKEMDKMNKKALFRGIDVTYTPYLRDAIWS